MDGSQRTVIVTGASQGIGAGVVRAFLARGYNVVGTARNATQSKEFAPSSRLSLLDGDIGLTGDGAEDRGAGAIVSTNLQGFLFINQLAVKQMLGAISSVDDIAEAVVYLTEARQITGEVLHVDGGAHSGKW